MRGNTSEECRQAWLTHFKSLVGKEVDETCSPEDAFFSNKVANCLPIKTGPFEMEEFTRSFKTRKAPGLIKFLLLSGNHHCSTLTCLTFAMKQNLETNQRLSLFLLSCHCLRKEISQSLPTTEVSLCPILQPRSTTQCFLIELSNTSILYSEETKMGLEEAARLHQILALCKIIIQRDEDIERKCCNQVCDQNPRRLCVHVCVTVRHTF